MTRSRHLEDQIVLAILLAWGVVIVLVALWGVGRWLFA